MGQFNYVKQIKFKLMVSVIKIHNAVYYWYICLLIN